MAETRTSSVRTVPSRKRLRCSSAGREGGTRKIAEHPAKALRPRFCYATALLVFGLLSCFFWLAESFCATSFSILSVSTRNRLAVVSRGSSKSLLGNRYVESSRLNSIRNRDSSDSSKRLSALSSSRSGDEL